MTVINIALNKTVTSSGTLVTGSRITDGDITTANYAYVTETGLHYVQVDLGTTYPLESVKVWHYYGDPRTYYATKTQISSDGTTWVTVFDSAVSGTYTETSSGVTRTFSITNARYIRDYINGSTANTGNHWVELQAFYTEIFPTTNYLKERRRKI